MNNIANYFITVKQTLKDALSKINSLNGSITLLVNKNNNIISTITDGDIRRLILKGVSLETKLDAINELKIKKPITALEGISSAEALQILNLHEIEYLPIVSKDNKPIKIIFRKEVEPIHLSTPHMGGDETKFIQEAFDSNWLAPLGPNVDAFEQDIANYVGTHHAAALISGTAAIHLALRILDVKFNDIVFCASFTFAASANPILYQGATPVFIDSEKETWNMCPKALEAAFEKYIAEGKKPKAVIIVNLYGQMCNMDALTSICQKYEVPIVEDAAESLGSTYKGQQSGLFGDIGIFSFNGNKIITTTGGGALVSKNKDYVKKARFLATQARDKAPYYQHSELGYNYRMSNVLAGIGRGQMKILNAHIKKRRQIFNLYYQELSHINGINFLADGPDCKSNKWLTTFTINQSINNITPCQLIEALSQENIEARHVWKPMHLQPLYKGCDYITANKSQDVCSSIFNEGICLPSASNLTEAAQMRVINCIKNILPNPS